MALAQVGLGSITQVAAATTASVYTVGAGKTSYIRSLVLYNRSGISTALAEIHVVPNSGLATGTASSITQIATVGLSTADTYFFELAYPITLNNTGDSIQVYNISVTDSVNVLVLGDKEA